jgi:UDP-3-O-[3-hydroxymyristoyl] glucosamine N-acyltransferase
MPVTTNFISKLFSLNTFGNDKIISSLNLCNRINLKPGTLSYITSDRFLDSIINNENIVSVLIEKSIYENNLDILSQITCVISESPEADFYKIHEYLATQTSFYNEFNFKTVIGANFKKGNNVFIDNEGVVIGDNVTIDSNSVIKKGTLVDDNCYIGCNAVIGCDGFQLIRDQVGCNILVTHVGGVEIRKNVFVGNGSIISKSLFTDSTYIGKNTKIDNLVHISHNCVIGENCVLTAGTTLSGSVTIEDRVWIGPNSTILNKVVCKKQSTIGIGSVVLNNVEENSKVFGNPARKIQ